MTRISITVLLALGLAFCSLGFLATFEPMPPKQQWTWRTVYALAGTACALGVLRPLLRPGRRK